LDRIASEYLRVLSWGDRQIPPELQKLKLTESLPTSEDVQMELDAAWGFNFYLPSQLLIMRFNPTFDRWYVENTDRHPTFKPISYRDLPKLIRRHIPNLEEQKAVLEIIGQRSPQDCYYQGWIRVGDINVLMRLREWRGNGEVIAPFSIRQRLHQEALRELSNY
jgi:CRISPR-associated protein (TIGR03985 family)